MTNIAIARHVTPALVPFVCSVIGGDANETLDHIIKRKEAERVAGSGEFWWGLGVPLGAEVEDKARQNGGTLPALFSESSTSAKHSGQVLVWQNWKSVLPPRQGGRIPIHVIVTSGHNPNTAKQKPHYALICHSNLNLALGNLGYCDLSPPRCLTAKNHKPIKYIVGARLLEKQLPLMSGQGISSPSVRKIAFEATLVAHCYVKLESVNGYRCACAGLPFFPSNARSGPRIMASR